VGEHVPNQQEMTFVRNLHAHNRRGIILSWATLNQGGSGHVNNHDPRYLRDTFEELGYVYDEALSNGLQSALYRGDFEPAPHRQGIAAWRARLTGVLFRRS
jgi:uncharacterized protein (DUF2249 family)